MVIVRNKKTSAETADLKRVERGGQEPAQSVRKQLITKEILVEATGVELFSVLTARKLLILRMARRAKKAPLPIPLYVYCTKILSRLDS